MNVLEQGSDDLAPVDYSDILQKILGLVRHENPFKISKDGNHLIVDLDAIATQIAVAKIQSPITSSQRVRSATVNFSPSFLPKFPGLIRDIRDQLKQNLSDCVQTQNFESIEQFVKSYLENLQRGSSNQLGLLYNFPATASVQKSGLETRRDDVGSKSLLKFHKLTISVRHISRFQADLIAGVKNHLEQRLGDEFENNRDDIEEQIDDLEENINSDFYKLRRVVDTESLGKLKKEAKIRYLEYLRDNLETQDHPDLVYLQDLIRRLKAIEEYIGNPDKQDGDYDVSYGGETINYREVFSRSEAFDPLPIIPIVTDSLGETTSSDGSDRTFTFGFKLKFNNPVQARGGDKAFDYHLKRINPESSEHKEEVSQDSAKFYRKLLKWVFLYYFAFATHGNPEDPNYDRQSELTYDVIENFDKRVLPILKGSDEDKKTRLLKNFVSRFEELNVRHKIKRLKKLLHGFIEQKTILQPRYFSLQIGVNRGILKRDPDSLIEGMFFNDVVRENPKKCLQYITIGESYPDEQMLCQLPAHLKIEDIRYYQTTEHEEFKIAYSDLKKVRALPVLFVPNSKLSEETREKNFNAIKCIVFPYNPRRLDKDQFNSVQAFVYQFTMSLLVYITLRILLDDVKYMVFVPILRFHEGTSEKPSPSEEFMADLSKVIAHFLNEKYRSNSQGIRIQDINRFKLQNALSSLYSVLPRTFTFTESLPRQDSSSPLDKLALIVVSSVESDGLRTNRDRQDRILTLFGEAVGITNNSGTVRMQLLKTFSANYRDRKLYAEPSILKDIVHFLYKDRGFRHFLYVAQAPYTDNLNLTQVQDESQYYFMSPTLIKFLVADLDDIYLYPIFFNKYYVKKSKRLSESSYSLNSTEQLLNLMEDESHKVVLFFNLFNGLSVGKGDDRFYNGVISYSTLLNIYPKVLDDSEIRRGLIEEGSLKQDILQYLTLFHFYRLEKNTGRIQLKLDPYDRIIGDESLRKQAVFNHMRGDVKFNTLAFLAEVNSSLYSETVE